MPEKSKKTNLEALKILHNIQRNLLRANQDLDIFESEDKDLPISDDVAAVLAAVDTATTAIADRIARLIAKSGLSVEEKAAFQVEIDKLIAMGKDDVIPQP